MREIVLDTETTGLDPDLGHRIVEIGALELVHHLPTGRSFHSYLNPERDVPEEVVRVHGLTGAFLATQPTFAEVVDALLEFLAEDPLVIHNAAFDMRFLNAELSRARRPVLAPGRAVDTLLIAQRRFPGQGNSLDALCKRFGVDATRRTRHGALLDSELLAEVYLHLMGGRQTGFDLVFGRTPERAEPERVARVARPPRPHAPSEAELARHAAFVSRLKDPIWAG
jgi:DNA polymerase-3 subunit epsilon